MRVLLHTWRRVGIHRGLDHQRAPLRWHRHGHLPLFVLGQGCLHRLCVHIWRHIQQILTAGQFIFQNLENNMKRLHEKSTLHSFLNFNQNHCMNLLYFLNCKEEQEVCMCVCVRVCVCVSKYVLIQILWRCRVILALRCKNDPVIILMYFNMNKNNDVRITIPCNFPNHNTTAISVQIIAIRCFSKSNSPVLNL